MLSVFLSQLLLSASRIEYSSPTCVLDSIPSHLLQKLFHQICSFSYLPQILPTPHPMSHSLQFKNTLFSPSKKRLLLIFLQLVVASMTFFLFVFNTGLFEIAIFLLSRISFFHFPFAHYPYEIWLPFIILFSFKILSIRSYC